MAIGADDKKKLYLLGGLAGLLGVAGLVILNPFKSSSPTTATPLTGAQPSATAGGASSGGYPGGGYPGSAAAPESAAAGSGAPASAALGGTTQAVSGFAGASGVAPQPQLVAAQKFRSDPFVPYFTKAATPPPTPAPLPPPKPLPPPLQPVILPSPSNSSGPSYPGLPSTGLPSSNQPFPVLVGLPTPRIARYVTVQTAPTVQAAPPNVSGGGANLTRSANKRLAGVIIGDSVRALLEIDDGSGGEPKTQIVQPGDEVEGVRVLRIERYTEIGGRTRVRMVVRENGEERSIELRPSTRPAGGGQGGFPGGGGGGYPGGGGGGYPGGGGGGYPGGGGGGYPGGGRPRF